MKIKSCRNLVTLTVCLLIFGCGGVGGGCFTETITDFSILPWPLSDDLLPENLPYRGGSSTVFIIRPNGIRPEPVASSRTTFSLFPLAQATSPCENLFLESITAIDVRSSQDIDGSHPAGSIINDLMKVQQFDVYLHSPQDLKEIFPIYRPNVVYSLAFNFAKPPINGGIHRFTLEIHLDTGAIHTVETEEIDLSRFRALAEPPIL